MLDFPHPAPLIHKLFRYRKCFGTQHRKVPLRTFSILRVKKFLTENRDTSPPRPMIHKHFRYQIIFEKVKCSPTKFFRYCETKNM